MGIMQVYRSRISSGTEKKRSLLCEMYEVTSDGIYADIRILACSDVHPTVFVRNFFFLASINILLTYAPDDIGVRTRR